MNPSRELRLSFLFSALPPSFGIRIRIFLIIEIIPGIIFGQAESILDALGIPVSNAINMFYKQIILQRGIPFELKLPAIPVPDMSELTKEQLRAEVEKGFADASAGRVTPAAELMKDLL